MFTITVKHSLENLSDFANPTNQYRLPTLYKARLKTCSPQNKLYTTSARNLQVQSLFIITFGMIKKHRSILSTFQENRKYYRPSKNTEEKWAFIENYVAYKYLLIVHVVAKQIKHRLLDSLVVQCWLRVRGLTLKYKTCKTDIFIREL